MSWCVVDGVVAFIENRLNSCETGKNCDFSFDEISISIDVGRVWWFAEMW